MSPSHDEILTALQEGQLTIKGEFLWGSNYTFLVQIEHAGSMLQGVYKPTRGERPLWDFPAATLARREVAAYVVSEAIGWQLVPPTIYRRKAPAGAGSLQFYIDHDPEYHYFNFNETDRQRLRPVALFDLLINNADRKGSHILIASDQHIWLIDHGICFHVEDKLRTVVWDFAGEPFPDNLCSEINTFRCKLDPLPGGASPLVEALQPYLSRGEIAALGRRADQLLDSGRFPDVHPNRRPYPWPPV